MPFGNNRIFDADIVQAEFRNRTRERPRNRQARNTTIVNTGSAGPLSVRSVSAADALVPSSDEFVELNPTAAEFIFTLTTPLSGNRTDFYLMNIATNGNAVTLTPASGQINGQATYPFSGSLQALHIAWDGSNWRILSGQ